MLESYVQPPEDPFRRAVGEAIDAIMFGRTASKRKPGRPILWRYLALAALETKIANPNARWRELERKYPAVDLPREMRRIRRMLDEEGIPRPEPAAYGVKFVIDFRRLVEHWRTRARQACARLSSSAPRHK